MQQFSAFSEKMQHDDLDNSAGIVERLDWGQDPKDVTSKDAKDKLHLERLNSQKLTKVRKMQKLS